jgi:putative membrane protein
MDQKKWKRHYLMRSLILLGFTILIAEMIITEKLSHYLAPRLHMLIYVTLSVLIVLTVVSLRQMFVGENDSECDCDAHKMPRTRWGALVVYGLFALPLAMGFVMPDKILGSAMAENLGVTLLSNDVRKLVEVNASAPATAATPAAKEASPEQTQESEEAPPQQSQVTAPPAAGEQKLDDAQLREFFSSQLGDFYTDVAVYLYKQPVIKLDEKVFLDGLTAMELFAKQFAGKEIETMGFVYHQDGFSAQQFVVARFSVSCCTADANVYGILVEESEATKRKIDSWVKVRGKLELRNTNGTDVLVLRATQVEQVEAPKDPYVYYSFETPVE